MATYTQALQRVFNVVPEESADNASPIDVPPNDSDGARSANNILQWRTYLPEDCIQTMIHMGWDVTT
jgi:hypothetical protein